MNQHFVPRVYLKNFAIKKRDDFYVDVFDLNEKKIFNSNIKNICVEKNLYTLNKNSKAAKNNLTVEKIYSNFLEPIYDEAYRILTNDSKINITPEERFKLFAGILPFYSRNPKNLIDAIPGHKYKLDVQIQIAKNKKAKGVTYLNEDFSFREYTDDEIHFEIEKKLINYFKDAHLKATTELAEIHENAVFEVLKSKDAKTWFFTSDYPLVFDDLIDKSEHPFKKSTDFTITISPNYAVKIYHDNRKETTKIYKSFTGEINVALINEQISKRARLFLIGSKDSFERQKHLKQYLDDGSIHNIMESCRQAYEMTKPTPELNNSLKLMAKYLSLYEQQGTLTTKQMQKFRQTQIELNKKWKKGIIE